MQMDPIDEINFRCFTPSATDLRLYRLMRKCAAGHEFIPGYVDKVNWPYLSQLGDCFFETFPVWFLKACDRESHNLYEKQVRVKKRVISMMNSGKVVKFVTLTFRDDVLSSTSPSTRRTYVRRYLNSCASGYVANIDFGRQNGREHYHAVVTIDSDHLDLNWSYGFAGAKSVRVDQDVTQLVRYQNKLAYHAVKIKSNLLYSKKAF